jgi:hypothetical protein
VNRDWGPVLSVELSPIPGHFKTTRGGIERLPRLADVCLEGVFPWRGDFEQVLARIGSSCQSSLDPMAGPDPGLRGRAHADAEMVGGAPRAGRPHCRVDREPDGSYQSGLSISLVILAIHQTFHPPLRRY